MAALHGREPGLVGTLLDEADVSISVIVDGIHVSDTIVRMLWRLKGPSAFVLIIDAIAAQGAPDGTYQLANERIEVKSGVARTTAGALAGSTITLDSAARNLRSITGATELGAIAAASANPNRLLGRPAPLQVGPGDVADIVLFDQRLAPIVTLIGGRSACDQSKGRLRRSDNESTGS